MRRGLAHELRHFSANYQAWLFQNTILCLPSLRSTTGRPLSVLITGMFLALADGQLKTAVSFDCQK